MKKQTPRGPEDMDCPVWQKPMSKVCHKCPKWVQVRGMDPQDHTKMVDRWDCSDAIVPVLLIELGRQMRSTAAAVETMTAEVKKTDADSQAMISTLLTVVNRAMDLPAQIASSTVEKTKLIS